MTLIFMRVHVPGLTNLESWVRPDFISEIHPRRSSSTPYDVIGSRLHLVTGREIEVVEDPDEVLEMIAVMLNRVEGGFSSEDDG